MHRLDELLHPGSVVLLGEVHGTNEYPAFCARLVHHAVSQHPELAVRVALEVSRSTQQLLTDHLDGRIEREELLADPHWSLRDGRGSAAVLALLDRLRELRLAGAAVDVLAIDVPRFDHDRPRTALDATGFYAIYGDRDRAMADAVLAARRRDPMPCTIALVGNWHSRCGTREPAAMGRYVRGEVPGLTALRGVDAGGTAWVATEHSSGLHPVIGYKRRPAEEIWWSRRLRPNGHHGWFDVGPVTASPPVRPDRVDSV